MRVVENLIRARPSRPPECQRVAAALRADPATGLARLARLAETLDERMPSPAVRLEALESLRPVWVAVIEPIVESLRNRPIPLSTEELAAFHRLAVALRALRDAWRRLHVDLRDAHPDGPAAPCADDARLALARALDAQSRLLTASCRMRIALPRDDWDALCRLAYPLWADEMLDERPAPGIAVHGGDAPTPRAALVLPLLLRLLEPIGLGGAALEQAVALARQTARRAGVHLDVDGQPHVGADGPALMLSAHHTVRLDTREALEMLARCRARLAAGASPVAVGVRTWLPPAAVDELLAGLLTVWAPGYVPTPLVRPPLAHALLRVGMPSGIDPETAAAQAAAQAAADEAEAAFAAGRRLYRYGKRSADGLEAGEFEFGQVERVGGGESQASGPAAARAPSPAQLAAADRADAIRALMRGEGETVEWRGLDPRRAVFARAQAAPRLRLGDVVAMLPMRAADAPDARRRPGSGPSRLRLGRVLTLAQTGAADGRAPTAHDLGVVFWPGAAVPVRVRIGDAMEKEGAWWLPPGADGGPSTLVLAPDRFLAPIDVVVDEPAGTHRMRLLRRVEHGPGYDRVELGPRV